MEKKYLTAESITEGHPDKLCDKIADAILDACLTHDSNARVACEVLATKGNIIVAGEITCGTKLGIRNIMKNVLHSVGYNPSEFRIQVKVHQQSPDIADGVGYGIDTGAGDQGIMYGYATDETAELLPLPVVLANKITAMVPVEKLVPYVNNARTHSADQVKKLQSSLREFGFIKKNPSFRKEYLSCTEQSPRKACLTMM